MEYQRIKLVWHGLHWLCPGVSTATCAPCGGGVVWNVSGRGLCGVVFGALLGPEATGPFCSNAWGHLLVFLLFLLPVALFIVHGPALVWVVVGGGLVDGVVV